MAAKQYLAVEQVARRLSLDSAVVEELLERHELPGLRLGPAWLIPEPELDTFLEAEFLRQNAANPGVVTMPAPETRARKRSGGAHAVTVTFKAQTLEMPNYVTAVIWVIEQLARRDPTFLQRFAAIRRGKRRYVSRNRDELYADRPDLPATQMRNGWWIGTNYSRVELERLLRSAARVAGINFDGEIRIASVESKAQPDPARAFIGIARSGLGDLASRHDHYLSEP